jgi:hypothetical protein
LFWTYPPPLSSQTSLVLMWSGPTSGILMWTKKVPNWCNKLNEAQPSRTWACPLMVPKKSFIQFFVLHVPPFYNDTMIMLQVECFSISYLVSRFRINHLSGRKWWLLQNGNHFVAYSCFTIVDFFGSKVV